MFWVCLILLVDYANSLPWIPYQRADTNLHPEYLDYEVLSPRASTSFSRFGNYIKQSLLAGYDFFDNAVPQINRYETARPSEEEEKSSFTRPRRHQEENSTLPSNGDLIKNITRNVEILNLPSTNRTATIQQLSSDLAVLANRVVTNTTSSDLIRKILERIADLENSAKEIETSSKLRLTRQELDESLNGLDAEVEDVPQVSTMGTVEVTAKQESGSSEEGGGNLVANLISSFLGGLSKPDGGVDVDAIVGLVAGLSVQKDDGSFDFSGLTELLQSFLGGGDENGGSDVGAFLGGLLGAILQGSANPPGPVGTGKLTGNLVANILPGLSGPAPQSSEETTSKQPQKNIDSGSFLAGLLTSTLGASSGSSSGSGANKMPTNGGGGSAAGSASFFNTIKNGIFKSIFSIITSVVASSSSSSSSSSSGKH